jgi:hypothetical protein
MRTENAFPTAFSCRTGAALLKIVINLAPGIPKYFPCARNKTESLLNQWIRVPLEEFVIQLTTVASGIFRVSTVPKRV